MIDTSSPTENKADSCVFTPTSSFKADLDMLAEQGKQLKNEEPMHCVEKRPEKITNVEFYSHFEN